MLLNTFSPKMVDGKCMFIGRPCTLQEVQKATTRPWPWMKNESGFPMWLCQTSAISHENTAKILSTLLNAEVQFERKNVKLGHGSTAWVIVPNFRTSEAREFTAEEVLAEGVSCYQVKVFDPDVPRYSVVGQADDVGGSLCDGGNWDTVAEAETAIRKMECEGFYPCWYTDHQGF